MVYIFETFHDTGYHDYKSIQSRALNVLLTTCHPKTFGRVCSATITDWIINT